MLLQIDVLLDLLDNNGHKLLCYGEDLVILAQGIYQNLVIGRLQQALDLMTR